MTDGNWRKPTSDPAAARRAGGRRRYNARRRQAADARRREVARLLFDGVAPGEMAQRLNVSAATISRDIAAIRAGGERCPLCGAPMPTPPDMPAMFRRLSAYLALRADLYSVQNAGGEE